MVLGEGLGSSEGDSSVTEVFLSDLFEAYLGTVSRKTNLPVFDVVAREFPAPVGVADFVGLACPDWERAKLDIQEKLLGLPRGPVAEVLSKLKCSSPRTPDYVIKTSNYSRAVITGAIGALIAAGVVQRTISGALVRVGFSMPDADIYFFEVKLQNWKRAIYQALQAKAYSSKVCCVFPSSKRSLIEKNRDIFRKNNVGVMLFNPEKWEVNEIVRSTKHKPKNASLVFDVLIRLAMAG